MSFSIERELPPTFVTRDLIEMIERIIKDFINANTGSDENLKNELTGRISIRIRDDQGEEEIRSISEMSFKKFHDSTKSVSVRFSGFWGVPLGTYEIAVRFFVRPSISDIRVSCSGSNARAMAVGVADSIVRVAQTSPNGNGFFHASPLKTGLLYFLLTIIFILARVNDVVGNSLYFGALGVILVTQVGHHVLGYIVFTYCTFDSTANSRRSEWKGWLIKGVISFLLFGSLLALLKDNFLNYIGMK